MSKNRSRRFATVAQAAEEFGVCDRTIRRYIASGRVAGYRLGPRMVRVDLDEIEAAMCRMGAA